MNFESNIVPNIIKNCSFIGNSKKFTGKEKKEWVLLRLKEEVKDIEKNEKIVNDIIDYIVSIDKREIIINKKTNKKNIFFCCY